MRLLPLSLAAAALLAPPTLHAQGGTPTTSAAIDWNAMRDEAARTLTDYVRINTTNPPGNELLGLRFLKGILDREGIEAEIMDTVTLGAGRGNLYARLRGDGSKRAIALVHHVDVVPAAPQFWTDDPFSGVTKGGFIYGRGTLDMKGQGVAHLMAMIALKRSGVPLTRDIVFIANSDEELGSTGALAFVDHHAELLKDVEFLITEGGDNPVKEGKLAYYGVGVAEKRTFWQHLSVKGTPSHASRPTKLNPVPRLVAALDRIARYETPLHVTPGVGKYFKDISTQYAGRERAWLANIGAALKTPAARAWILDNVYWNAILRNTISLTMLNASNKINVIPAEATADIDIRLLPDTDPKTFLATLQRIVADTAIHFAPLLALKAPLDNPIDTDLFRSIERAAHERDPGALVTTPMFTAATDRPTYRKLGIITYGLDPFKVESSDMQSGMHGNNERLSVETLGFGVRFMYDVLRHAEGSVTP